VIRRYTTVADGMIVGMSISIRRVGDRYSVVVRPPHGSESWQSSEPLSRADLIEKLRGLGCHTTDIGDAFYAADPDWLSRDEGDGSPP